MIRNISKRLIQVFLVGIELIGGSFLIACIFNYFFPITTKWDMVERMMLGYAVYQIVVYLILTNCNDIRKDSYLALLWNYKMVELYLESNDYKIKEKILKNIEDQLRNDTLNDDDIRNEYEDMKQIISDQDKREVKIRIIWFEHKVEAATLNWKYSFLLRLVK